ncbi:hypothetical protein E5161_08000 [Cohnella pontilimi]|uniref:BIG2 domain-containing protein n=1 Tax=Cohnella pontilimi TaxID=2564100 RepID=A0A4U0FD80_9BACL|nr:hypothetical protein [Cohnella pontilimi]TJY42775.1 hypothetical protein E5161_08000 [Cohnella pontilimi]
MNTRYGTKSVKRWIGALLIALLVANAAAGLVSAEETVNSIELQGAPSSPIQLYVDDAAVNLTVWAYIDGSSVARNVTADALWTSSSSAVKVDRGVLTATGSATGVTITAKYKTKTATATVNADYVFGALKLQSSGADAADQMNIKLDATLSLDAIRIENDGSTGVSVKDSAQWVTSNSSVATVSRGVISLLNPGTVTITAKYKGRADSVVLTVTSPYKSLDIKRGGSRVSAPIELEVGGDNVELEAAATWQDGTSAPSVSDVAVWTTSNASVLKVDKGVLTTVGAGSAVVTAKRYGVSDAVTVYVRTPYEAIKLTSARTLSFTLYGAPIQVNATVAKGTEAPIDVSTTAVWQVADPMIAVVDVSSSGVFVKPKSVGSTKVTVTYKGLSKDLAVTVYPSITTVDIPTDRLNLFEGETVTLPIVKGTNIAGDTLDISKLVVWKSSDESIVSMADGKLKAIKTGTVTLTAEVENEPNQPKKADTIQVEVHKNVLALIPDNDYVSIVTGSETDLPKVKLTYTDGDEADISDKIEWKSSSANLLIKAGKMKGLLPGAMTLTGTYLKKTVTVKVQVEEKFVSFDIVPRSIALTLNRSQPIKVTATTVSGKKVNLSSRIDWTASAGNKVQVKGASVKGLAEGSGKLTATVQGKILEIPFTVTAKLVKLKSSDSSLSLKAGETDTVKIEAVYENGKTIDVTKTAVWTSNNRKVATAEGGVVKAAGKGSASIKAEYQGKAITIRITVK